METINSLIRNNDTWTLTNNCSSFAVKVWNSVSSVKLDAGTVNTPTSLMNSIKSKSGYQTGKAIPASIPIGYLENGSFISVTKINGGLDEQFGVPYVSYGIAEFIVPINLNPNSMQQEVVDE